MLAQNKAILFWCGDDHCPGDFSVGGGFISMLQTVYSPDVNVICL